MANPGNFDRSVLTNNDQNNGDTSDITKLENILTYVADLNDANFSFMQQFEGTPNYAADSGSTDDYAVTLTEIATYTPGLAIRFKSNTANTGSATLNVNGLGARAIKKNSISDLSSNDISAGQIVEVVYDGANFQLIGAVSSTTQDSFIINGNMEVNQRVGPYTIATAAAAYTVDRMRSMNTGSGANATVSQVAVADLEGSNFGLQIIHATAPTVQGKLMQSYTLEARDSYKMAGQTRTISVKVKGVVGMNQAQLFARYRTTEGAISDTSTLIGQSALVTINTGAWTDVPLTVTLPNRATLTANGCIGYLIVFSKTSAESSGDGAIIAQWHDNIGSDAKPFQPRSFADELALCQRHCRLFTAAGASAAISKFGVGMAFSSTTGTILINFPEMRVSPTAIYSPAAQFQVVISSGASGLILSAISTVSASRTSIEISFTSSSGLTAGSATLLIAQNNNTAFILLDAEI